MTLAMVPMRPGMERGAKRERGRMDGTIIENVG